MEFDQATYEKIDAYIFGRLTGKEKELFEKEIEGNIELKKEVILNKAVKASIANEDWTLLDHDLESDQVKHIASLRRSDVYTKKAFDLKNIGDTYFETLDQKPKRSKRLLYIAVTAAAAVLLIFFIGNYSSNPSTEALYAEYNNWDDLPSLTLQGDTTANLAKGEELFNKGAYQEVIALFTQNIEESQVAHKEINPYVLSYLGASYLESGAYNKALETFNILLKNNTLDSSKGYWYKAMVYLKQGNREKAIEELKLLTNNKQHFNFDVAKRLLRKLE
ncbi:tetratricopeptide repeat protein [Aquimarina pacifica]|uniref:tetratricopeptide repeat protein n=1 Tax=Aquimarina pacifica TaxID=1296415 RepID=UPI0004BB16F8|nr:hypothetical protein [Aquimarina pacifica]